MKRFAIAILCPLALANAQVISFGVTGGFPFNGAVSVIRNDSPFGPAPIGVNYTVGPVVQVKLPANFGLEADMLYRPFNLTESTFILGLVGGTETVRITASQFRFPLLLQYRLGHRRVKPYVEAGLSVDHLATLSATTTINTFMYGTSVSPGGIPAQGPGSLDHQTHIGAVAGAGLEVKIPLVRMSAGVRYTRQGDYFSSYSNVNQGEVLIGIHF